MMPSTVLDPDATKEDLELSISIVLDHACAALNFVTDNICDDDKQVQAESASMTWIALYNMQAAKEMYAKYQDLIGDSGKVRKLRGGAT